MDDLKTGRLGVHALFCVFALTLAGCASAPIGGGSQDADAKRFVARPDVAGLYIYRTETIDAALKIDLALDGKPIGPSAAHTYYFLDVEPGRHTVTSTSGNSDSLDIDMEAGQLYYVWQEVKMGFLAARTELHRVDADEGRKGVLESSLAAARLVPPAMPAPTPAEPMPVAAASVAPPETAEPVEPAAPSVPAMPVEPAAASAAAIPAPAPMPAEAPIAAHVAAPPVPVVPPPPAPPQAPAAEPGTSAGTVALVARAELHDQPRSGSPVTAALPAGTRVKADPRTIHNPGGDWCYVTAGDRSGWVLKSALPD
ncbi:MAG TPA: DUF2846 domain-containing protein [Solimonas sp.]|nr:DUF2846 domain-containing protein [Solimonas sp.]